MRKYMMVCIVFSLLLLAGCQAKTISEETPQMVIPEPELVNVNTVEAVPVETGPEVNVVTAQDLAAHGYESDCWVGFESEVYDITEWIPSYDDASEELVPNCGKSIVFEEEFIKKYSREDFINELKFRGVYMGSLE